MFQKALYTVYEKYELLGLCWCYIWPYFSSTTPTDTALCRCPTPVTYVSNSRPSGLLQCGLLSQVWTKWRAMRPVDAVANATVSRCIALSVASMVLWRRSSVSNDTFLKLGWSSVKNQNRIEIEFCSKKSNRNRSRSDNQNRNITI